MNILVFPLDTLKTRLQSSSLQQTYRSTKGPINRALWRNLYQGVGTTLLVTVPSSGVFFTTYEGLKYILGASPSAGTQAFLPQPAVHALSSSIAQLVNCAVVIPVEVIKQNAQMLPAGQGSSLGGGTKALRSPTMTVLRELKGQPAKLWRGYTALAARDLPFTALQFPAFEYLKETLVAVRSKSTQGGKAVEEVFERAWISAVSAGLAGSAAAWVTTPFDVVKTRMMLEAGAKDNGRGRRSGLHIGKEVLREEGMRGLFRGGFIRATFTILENGLYMGCYEGAKLYLLQEDC